MRASLVLRRKEIDEQGNVVELAIWRAPVISPARSFCSSSTARWAGSCFLPSLSVSQLDHAPPVKRPWVFDALSVAVASGFRRGASRTASASASCRSASRIAAGSITSACTP